MGPTLLRWRGDDGLHAIANDDQVDTLDCGPSDVPVWLNANESDTHVNCEKVFTVTITSAAEEDDE